MHIANSPNAATLFAMMGQQNQLSHSQNKAMQNDLAQMAKSFHPAQTLPANGAEPATPSVPANMRPDQGLTQQGQSQNTSNQGLATQAQVNSAAAARASMANSAHFTGNGNLSNGTSLKDFALINNQQVLLQQSLRMSQVISTTQANALQPAMGIQVAIILKLYEKLDQTVKARQQIDTAIKQGTLSGAQADADLQTASAQAQLLASAFLERVYKLFDGKLALGRLFKKGPDGEDLHNENTDDEYGTQYADVDAETDYIKRPRHYSKEMQFHYSMLK